MRIKKATSFRLTEEALTLLAAVSAQMGLTQAAALELAIRLLAKRERRS